MGNNYTNYEEVLEVPVYIGKEFVSNRRDRSLFTEGLEPKRNGLGERNFRHKRDR